MCLIRCIGVWRIRFMYVFTFYFKNMKIVNLLMLNSSQRRKDRRGGKERDKSDDFVYVLTNNNYFLNKDIEMQNLFVLIAFGEWEHVN